MNNEERITNFSKSILSNIKSKDMNSLKTLLSSANEVDILDMIQDLSDENQAIVFRLLSKDTALFVFERLDTGYQQQLIRSFTDESAIEIIEGLDPDERVRLFEEMPAKFVKKMLSALSPEERAMTNLLMGYGAETAGRVMTPEYVHLHKGITVSEAMEKVKAAAVDNETIYTIYITDSARRLEGVISLRDLLIADPAAKVEDVMEEIAAQVYTDTDQEEVARLLKRLDWLAIPVVDKENRLVGIVTIDDAVDILEEEATEDIMGAAGLMAIAGKEADRSMILTKGSLPRIWLVRLPFLLIALAGGIAAGFIIEGFEEILESVVVIAFFIPVILDMGGSVGSQSSTVFARGVVLGHINMKAFLKPFAKEIWVGLTIGLISGGLAAGIILIWQGFPTLAIVVGIALTLTMTVAAALGFLTPFVTMKLKMDQAAASAPIITTIKDITGLFIYFALVALLMGSYLESTYEITGMNVTVDGMHFFLDVEEETATVVGREDDTLDIVIPEVITIQGEEFTVTSIGDGAFRDNGLISLALPGSVTSIGNNAFRENQLEIIIFSYGLEIIGENAFRENLLEEINLPASLIIVERGGFRDNNLSHIELPGSLQVLGSRAFMDNNLVSIVIPNAFTEFAYRPETSQYDHFRNNNIESIFTDISNASFLADMLTEEVMRAQYSEVTVMFDIDTNDAIYQRNNIADIPRWESAG